MKRERVHDKEAAAYGLWIGGTNYYQTVAPMAPFVPPHSTTTRSSSTTTTSSSCGGDSESDGSSGTQLEALIRAIAQGRIRTDDPLVAVSDSIDDDNDGTKKATNQQAIHTESPPPPPPLRTADDGVVESQLWQKIQSTLHHRLTEDARPRVGADASSSNSNTEIDADLEQKQANAAHFWFLLRQCVCLLLGTSSTTATTTTQTMQVWTHELTSHWLNPASHYSLFGNTDNNNNTDDSNTGTDPTTALPPPPPPLLPSLFTIPPSPRILLHWVGLLEEELPPLPPAVPPPPALWEENQRRADKETTHKTTLPNDDASGEDDCSAAARVHRGIWILVHRHCGLATVATMGDKSGNSFFSTAAAAVATGECFRSDKICDSLPQQQEETIRQTMERQQSILEVLGWEECADCLRIFYFCSQHGDSSWWSANQDDTTKETRSRKSTGSNSHDTRMAVLETKADGLFLGRTVKPTLQSTTLTSSFSSSYNPCRSKINAVVHFASLLPVMNAAILQALLPIIYSLLNASSDETIRYGAAMLYHLLQIPNMKVPQDSNDSGDCWTNTQTGHLALDNMGCIFENLIKIHRVGPTLAVLGTAQRSLLQRRRRQGQNNNNNAAIQKALITALKQWLFILERNNRHYARDYLVWGLLVGGIVPLSYDAASGAYNTGTYDDASYCEIGRMGLSALLSVLRGDAGFTKLLFGKSEEHYMDVFLGNDPNDDNNALPRDTMEKEEKDVELSFAVQTAALVALQNVLVAAYGIMPRHGAKLMCELVVYSARLAVLIHGPTTSASSTATLSYVSRLHDLSLQTAAIALVICGNSANAALERLTTNTSQQYEDEVAKTVSTIRLQSLQINM